MFLCAVNLVFPKPVEWCEKQLYITALASESLAAGQGVIASSSVPDLHHFRGSFGGKDVIPLYLNVEATRPNITKGLLEILSKTYGTDKNAEDLAAYVYAVLGGQSYTKRFWNELETPGPRVPLTKDAQLFMDAVRLGRRLIWLHTYAERFQGDGRGADISPGVAKNLQGVSSDPAQYPEDHAYDTDSQEIRIGDGLFGPVVPEIWEFEVSGLKVVQSWLGYRMKKRAGKKSSPLDDTRPERWTARMTDEFLELLWVLEATLAMEPELSNVLDKIVAGDCFNTTELPTPTNEERRAPATAPTVGDQLDLLGAGSEKT